MTPTRASERAACEFFEALLKVEYPGRRVAVTPAPFSDDLPEDVSVQLDGSGVLDVTVGARDDDPAWACFRCAVQFEVTRRDWLAAARILLDEAKRAFEDFRSKAGLPPAVNEADKAVSGVVQILQEAARRANWDAQQGPDHLRTGRFTGTSKGEPGKG